MTAILVTGQESLEQIYFLIRVGTWHPEHVQQYLAHQAEQSYQQGVEDGQQDSPSTHDVDDAYTRGFDQGHDQGYRDGFNDGARESNYNNSQRLDSWR